MTTLRIFLHVTSGATWVFAGAGLLWLTVTGDPARRVADVLASVASAALTVVVATGIWSILATGSADRSDQQYTLLGVKLLAAVVSFSASWLHHGAESHRTRMLWAASLVTAGLIALYLGVALDVAESTVEGHV